MTPLPRDRPLWSIILITELSNGAVAVVVVLHHVLADGLGGLNVLTALVDPGAPPAAAAFPRPVPSRASLARDAWTTRLEGIRRADVSWGALRRGVFAGGGRHPPRATPCSLVHRTGPRRRMAVLKLDRARLAAAAHRSGATTNDAVLVAVAAALHQILLGRAESVDPVVVTVPVSGRRPGGGPGVGNLVRGGGTCPQSGSDWASTHRGSWWIVSILRTARWLSVLHESPAPIPHACDARPRSCGAGSNWRTPDQCCPSGGSCRRRQLDRLLRGPVVRRRINYHGNRRS